MQAKRDGIANTWQFCDSKKPLITPQQYLKMAYFFAPYSKLIHIRAKSQEL